MLQKDNTYPYKMRGEAFNSSTSIQVGIKGPDRTPRDSIKLVTSMLDKGSNGQIQCRTLTSLAWERKKFGKRQQTRFSFAGFLTRF